MQPNKRPRGFFTFVQNTPTVDYIRLAYGLALSLKKTQPSVPYLTIGVEPGTIIETKYAWAFDSIVEIPWGDDAIGQPWKLQNEWKAIWMSPYEHTIKLDCDMLFFSDISSWWTRLIYQESDVVWTNTVLDWRGSSITNDFYRKVFTKNNLPNIYTGLSYFRKTDYTFAIFNMAKLIFWNWQAFFEQYLHPEYRPTYPSTDVIFALAMRILDLDDISSTPILIPTFTHMKSQLQGWQGIDVSEDWRTHLNVFFNSNAECKLGNHRQYYPLHYHVKEFLTDDILSIYERLIDHA
jgi:hypothetical protein